MHVVFHVVSRGSGEGKTRLLELLVREFAGLGVPVAVVKHTPHGFAAPVHDTERLLGAGAVAAAAHAGDSYMVEYRRALSLQELVDELPSPPVLVLVEGYSSKPIGPVIHVTLRGEPPAVRNPYACVSDKPVEGCPKTYGWGEVPALARAILEEAYKRVAEQLPGINCAMCGSDCTAMAWRILRGEARLLDCPVRAKVRLVVDGRDVPINPFVKNIIREVVEALVRTLKGVPEKPREITIKIQQ